METPYRAVKFLENETVTRDIMDAVGQNLQYIHDNTPRSRLFNESRQGSVKVRDSYAVIMCGRLIVGKSKKEETVTRQVRFGKGFAPDCVPNVTYGTISQGAGNIYVVMNGTKEKVLPDSTGFDMKITAPGADGTIKKKKWAIAKPIFINWQAFGYRTET